METQDFIEPNEAKKLDRYKDFIILDKPIKLKDLLKDSDFIIIQVHSLYKCLDSILGFVGVFAWENNQLINIDGDTYDPNMIVYAYKEFSSQNIENGVDILVKEW